MAKRNNYSRNIGSVSCGTMRPEDLIPDFTWELKQMKPLRREHRQLIREIEHNMETVEDYFSSEDASIDLNEGLFDALDAYALPYFGFGSHPGDGADYGFWLSESFPEEFDGLQVSDTADVPKGYTGEVLHVNDHGNMTLYVYSRGRGRELWAVV
jgi:hypothetical protein